MARFALRKGRRYYVMELQRHGWAYARRVPAGTLWQHRVTGEQAVLTRVDKNYGDHLQVKRLLPK